ncbi:MAG: DNA recombination protein RmuC [Treponemataceae bacterium]|nr:DNA recombination protein RmuC [Treponemataceae bacterium]
MELYFVAFLGIAFFILVLLLLFLLRPRTSGMAPLLELIKSQEQLREGMQAELARNRDELTKQLRLIMEGNLRQMASLREEIVRFGQGNEARLEKLRETVDWKLREIQEDSARTLEAIRKTVDDKLHETLERRLGESFKLVGERLEQVQAGLGEMRSLAAGVGDLKKVLVNVKNRGTWGEVQLIRLVEDLLSPTQYILNGVMRPGSNERVEVAIALPGRDPRKTERVYLPIDAKFPKEDYERLLEARDQGDPLLLEEAQKNLERRFKNAARDISEKYIAPPHTTDFAIMFLPSEGLFAECLSRPGLAEYLQREHRVVVAGPTTLAALINSLQMGFKTLAVEQRTAEIWKTLNLVKEEFSKFGELLEKTRKKLQEAADTVDLADKKTRSIQGKLSAVEELEGPEQ